MASLTAHLRRPVEHGRLPFHPDCPICCHERLAGTMPPDAVVGRRTQALLAAGVIALSTATPPAVLAAEPDQEQEGAAAPDPAAAEAPPSAPTYDSGGDSTDLPFDAPAVDPGDEAAPSDQEPTADDAAPVVDSAAPEQELAIDVAAPVVDSGEATDQLPAPPAQEVASTPPPPAATELQPPPVTAPAPETAAPPPAPEDADATRPRRDRHASPRRVHSKPSNAAPSDSAPAANVPAPSTVLVVQTQPSTSTTSGGQAARPGDRVHVVAPGESLWSIAGDVLGDGASVARTAREVNRLWELNRGRIATGDPDLLMVGTRLALR